MRSRILVFASLCAALAISACGSSGSSGGGGSDADTSGSSTSASTQPASYGNCEITGKPGTVRLTTTTSGTLTIGTVLPLPGYFNGVNPDDVKDGFEYCLAAEIANAAGIPNLAIRNVSFEKVIAGDMSGLDMLMAGVFITPERREVVDFSIPYFTSYSGVLVRSDDLLTESDIHDAKIGVLAGTLPVDFVRTELRPTQSESVFQALSDMYTALKAKRVDAAITDTTEVLSQEMHSNGAFKVVGQYRVGGENGIVFPKGSPNVAPVDQVIESLKSDGTIDQLEQRYMVPAFGRNPSEVPFWTP